MMDIDALQEEMNEAIMVVGSIAHWLGMDESLYDSDDFYFPQMLQDLHNVLKAKFGQTVEPVTQEMLQGQFRRLDWQEEFEASEE